MRRAYEDLAEAPCSLLAVSLEDVLQVRERPNMPGTTDEWPNWRRALPVPLETVEQLELPRSVASRLSSRVGSNGGGPIESHPVE